MLIEVFNQNVNAKFTNILGQFNSPVFLAKALKAGNTAIVQCGLLHYNVEYPVIGNVRVFSKVILLNQPHIVRFESLNLPFNLIFEKLNLFESFELEIYRETMPLEFEPQQSNNKGSTTGGTPVNTSANSVTLLAANANRKALRVVNASNRDMYINFGATATLASYLAKLPKMPTSGIPSAYEDDNYTGVVSGIWESTGSGSAQVIEVLP